MLESASRRPQQRRRFYCIDSRQISRGPNCYKITADCFGRVTTAQSVAASKKPPSLEQALRDFDFVTGLELYVERRIFAKPPDIENCDLRATKKPNALLIGKIVEPAGGVDRSEQRHVLGERHAGRCSNGAANVHETRRRLHHDRDIRIGVDVV